MELLKECTNKRVYGLRGGWTITEIDKKKKKKKEGLCIKGWVDTDWNCQKKVGK